MRNSFIIVNGATKNQDLFKKSIVKRGVMARSDINISGNLTRTESGRIQEPKSLSSFIQQDKRPAARDGHTGIIVKGQDANYLVVFGGDRHGMPFNDMFMLDLKAELAKSELFC